MGFKMNKIYMYFKNLLKIGVFSTLVLGTVPVAQAAGCTSTVCTGEIERIFYNAAGDMRIRLKSIDIRTQAQNCTTTANYGVVKTDNPRLKEFYAMALTVMALNKEISMRFLDASNDCEVQYTYVDN